MSGSWSFSNRSVVEERTRFVIAHEDELYTMAELCRIYGISRETGYYWLHRYREGGLEALRELGRAPRRHPNQTPEEIEQAVLELRRGHMTWGARKLKRVLERDHPGRRWPAASTMGAMLAREGLVVRRRKRQRTPSYRQPFAAADAPNRVWCADFKGWFRTGDGARMDPLTSATRAALPGRGENRQPTGAGHLRGGVSRARHAGGDSQRQRRALCLPGYCRSVAAGGVVDEAGDCAGAHCRWTSGAEWATRADASHAEAGDGLAARGQSTRAAASF